MLTTSLAPTVLVVADAAIGAALAVPGLVIAIFKLPLRFASGEYARTISPSALDSRLISVRRATALRRLKTRTTGSLQVKLMPFKSGFLNVAANAALVVAVGALGTALWYRHAQTLHETHAARPAANFRPGDRAPVVDGVNYASSPRSVILFLSTTCHFCESAAPFYNRLHSSILASHQKSKLVAVFSESEDQVRTFKTRLNLTADTLAGRRFAVSGTPTALVVDKSGVITGAWLGTSKAIDSEILSAATTGQ